MRAADLVNARAELVRRLGEPTGSVQGSLHKMVLMLGATAAARAKGVDFAQLVGTTMVDEARLMQSMAKLALSYRVSEEMCALTEFAASQLGEEDTFDATLPLSECGLLYFERPIHLGMKGSDMTDDPELSEYWDSTDASQAPTLPIRWLLWGPAHWQDRATGQSTPGIVIHSFYDLLIDGSQAFQTRFSRDNDEETSIADALGRWGYLGAFMVPDRSRIVQTRSGDVSKSSDHNGRIVIALFRLLAQVIAVTEVEQADPKKLSRTARRIKLLPQVTTIRLRRQKGVSREPGESMVEWSHRWLVRGHWRNQAYGPGRAEHRRIWIAPHIRGPEDKPLADRPHVYSLER